MHSIPPPTRFLVLSAASSAPYNPANQFLVLSPTESGPDPRFYDEQAVTETSDGVSPLPKERRSDSSSSVDSEFNDVLPNGFLYLGHTSRRYSQ